MGRLEVTKCPMVKRSANASPLFVPPKKVRVGEPNLGGQPPLPKGPSLTLPSPPPIIAMDCRRKGKEVNFDAIAEQPVRREILTYSPERAPTLYEEFLTGGLSQRIEEGNRIYLRHTLLRYTLISASLAYKDMLEAEGNEAERKELVVGAQCEKQLLVEL
ncbi:hypothetical protein ACOSQ4_029374 [Xanthoceras sorbifolium]